MLVTNRQAQTITKAMLEANVCRKSFYDFFLRFWPELIAEKLVDNWHVKLLCDLFQETAERAMRRESEPGVWIRLRKLNDVVVNISPGSTKSTILSVMSWPWVLTRDPTFKMICGSYAYPLSLYLASQAQRIIQTDKYKTLFPEVELVKDSQGLMTTTAGGQRICTSTGGSITGMHGHMILIDDPINPKDAISDVALKNANDWFDHTLISRMVDKKVTPVFLVMQRLHQNDPSGHMLGKTGTPVRHICLPARVNPDVRPRGLRMLYRGGGLFDPSRLPEDVLKKAQEDMGEYAFAGQYMQRPVPMGGGAFKTSQIIVWPAPGSMVRTVRYWDKAGTSGRGAWTVGVLMGLDRDRTFWVLDVIRGQWEASEREKIIRQTAEIDTKKVLIGVEQEPGSGGKESAQATVKNLAGWRVRLDKVTGDKETRADPFAVQVNGGNVKIVRAPWNAKYLHELSFFPHSTFKDQVDASSGAFAMLTKFKLVVGGFG